MIRATKCPMCKRPLQYHFVNEAHPRSQQRFTYAICAKRLECGLVTCVTCDITIDKATGRAMTAGRFVYSA